MEKKELPEIKTESIECHLLTYLLGAKKTERFFTTYSNFTSTCFNTCFKPYFLPPQQHKKRVKKKHTVNQTLMLADKFWNEYHS